MNLLDFSDALLRRTSQFNLQDWLRSVRVHCPG